MIQLVYRIKLGTEDSVGFEFAMKVIHCDQNVFTFKPAFQFVATAK